MTLSPSEIFQTAMSGKNVYIQSYMVIKKSQHSGRLKVQFIFDQQKETQVIRSVTVNNPLAMMQAINTLNDELKTLIAERDERRASIKAEKERQREAQRQAELAQRGAENAKLYLEEARTMVEKINARKQREAEHQQLHTQRYILAARKPIQAILERVTPVIDPWSYRNVYGKPAEVFIF